MSTETNAECGCGNPGDCGDPSHLYRQASPAVKPARPLWAVTDQVHEHLVAYERLLEESGGEVNEEVEAELESLFGDWRAKVSGVWAMVRRLRALQGEAEAAAKSAAALAKAREKDADGLEEYLLRELRRLELTEVDAGGLNFKRIRSGTPSARWTSAAPIPEELVKPWAPPPPPPPELDGTKAIRMYQARERVRKEREKLLEKAARAGQTIPEDQLPPLPPLPEGVEYRVSERIQVRGA